MYAYFVKLNKIDYLQSDALNPELELSHRQINLPPTTGVK